MTLQGFAKKLNISHNENLGLSVDMDEAPGRLPRSHTLVGRVTPCYI